MTVVLAVAIGLVVGLVLGAVGGGGGVLTVPALVYLLGESTHQATTASLVIVGVAALVGLPAHARSGNVQWQAGLAFGAVGSAAAVAGTLVGRHVDPPLLLLGFALVILASAILMIRDARRRHQEQALAATKAPTRPEHSRVGTAGTAVAVRPVEVRPAVPTGGTWTSRYAGIALGGLAVGLMTGLFGVGGGFLAVPVLVLVMRWTMATAVGTSLLVIVLNSLASLAPRLTDHFDWTVIGPVTVAAAVGVVLGKLVCDRVSSARLGATFGVMLIGLSGYTGVTSALALLG